MNKKITLPMEVRGIIEALEARGFEAYAVGGAVRDMCIGAEPGDFDITTSALPEEVKEIFPRTIDTGIAHGTVTVMKHGTGYEVTTYRIDGEYRDARHPEAVEFTRSLREDLRRRDFTVNAMAYNDRTGLVDLFGGCEDLEKGVIRAVGTAEERFREDALRIMRCVRFAAQLNFTIEEKTFRAATELSGNLRMISRERVREEFLKILLSDHPEKILVLQQIGAFSGWCEVPVPVMERTARVLQALPKDRVVRTAGFLSDLAGLDASRKLRTETADRILSELKFDNETRDTALLLVSFRDLPLTLSKTEVRKVISETGYLKFDLLMDLLQAELSADGCSFGALDTLRVFRKEVEDAGDCVRMKDMKISGTDLIRMGLKPGKTLGAVLKTLFQEVLEHPEYNTEEILQKKAEELIASVCKEKS